MEDRRQKMEDRRPIQKCKDLDVYNDSFELAMNIFEESRKFPKEELYSLVDQLRRSSRSIPVNVREGFAKRRYPDVFVRHLNDALGSCEETQAWLEFAFRCGYITKDPFRNYCDKYEKIGRMLYKLMQNWRKF